MTSLQILYPATAEKAAELRTLLADCGCKGARVARIRSGAARVVLKCREDRDNARDALVLADARTPSGLPFTDPDSRFAWSGTCAFVRFGTP